MMLSKQSSMASMRHLFAPDRDHPRDPLQQAHASLYEEFEDEDVEMYTDPSRMVRSSSIEERVPSRANSMRGGIGRDSHGDEEEEDAEAGDPKRSKTSTIAGESNQLTGTNGQGPGGNDDPTSIRSSRVGSGKKETTSAALYLRATVRKTIFMTLDHPTWSPMARFWGMFMSCAIILSCLTYVMGTMHGFRYTPEHCRSPVCVPNADSICDHEICFPQPIDSLVWTEMFTMIIFSIDYLLRVVTVHAVPERLIYPELYVTGKLKRPEPNGLIKTLQYSIRPMNLIDLIAVLPFYLHFGFSNIHTDLVFLRLVRLVRVFRVFKLSRYTEGHALVINTLLASVPALILMLFSLLVITVFFGAVIFYCEEGTFKVTSEYPDGAYLRPTSNGAGEELSPFRSIPVGAYWVVMTATTVGYGDFYPSSYAGRCVAVVVAYSGIISIALPVTIIGKHFNDLYFRAREVDKEETALLAKDRKDYQRGGKVPSPVPRAGLAAAAAGEANSTTSEVPKRGGRKGKSQQGGLLSPYSLSEIEKGLQEEDLAGGELAAVAEEEGRGKGNVHGLHYESIAEDCPTLGLRKRVLTNLIRDQLRRMDKSTQYLMARLDELENLSNA